MKKFLFLLITIFSINVLIMTFSSIQTEAASPLSSYAKGAKIIFGGNEWILLEPSTGFMLSSTSIGKMPFNTDGQGEFSVIDTNNIGFYLNNAYLNTFSASEQEVIQMKDWTIAEVMMNSGEAATIIRNSPPVTAKIAMLNFGESNIYDWYIPRTINNANIMYLRDLEYDGFYRKNSARVAYWYGGSDFQHGTEISNKSHNILPTLYLKPSVLISGNVVITPSAPNPPVITYPGNNQNSPLTSFRMGWNFSDNDAGDYQTAYQVVGTTTNWSSWEYNSGWISSGNNFHDLSGLVEGNWHFLVRYKDSAGMESSWAINDGIVNYKVDTQAPANGRVPIEWDTTYKETGVGSNIFNRYVNLRDGESFRVHVVERFDNLSGTAMSAFWWQRIKPTGYGTWDYESQPGVVWEGDSSWYKDIPVNGEGQYHVVSHVHDNAGNWNWEKRIEWNVYVDRTLPLAESFETPYSTKDSSAMRVHLLNITDNLSGVNRVEYSSRRMMSDGTVEDWQRHGAGFWDNGESGIDNYFDIPNRGEGIYEIHAYTYDNAGNVNGPWKTTVNVDYEYPFLINDTITGADYVNGNEHYMKPGTTIQTKLHLGDRNSGVTSAYQVFVGATPEAESGYLGNNFYDNIKSLSNLWDTTHFTIDSQIDNYEAGKRDVETTISLTAKETTGIYAYSRFYSVVDKAGNNSKTTNAGKDLPTGKKIIIDGEKPSGALAQNPSSGTRTNGTVMITISGTDGGSGFKQIKNPDGTISIGGLGNYAVSRNGTYSFELEDNVGNKKVETITITNINENTPTVSLTGIADAIIRNTYQMNLQSSDADASDILTFTISAGSSPGQSNYNSYLSTAYGTSRGILPIGFNLNTFPSSELVWNHNTSRYEKAVYLTATVSDGLKTVTTSFQFIIYNRNPNALITLPDINGYRNANDTLLLTDYFTDSDGHTIIFTANSANNSIATVSIVGNYLTIVPKNFGATIITVNSSDGLGGTFTNSFTYNVKNNAPTLNITNITTGIVGMKDVVKITGTVLDQENDLVMISTNLGGKVASTTVPNGNGTWEIQILGAQVEQGIYNNIEVIADDSYDVVSKIHSFSDLLVDTSPPFFWAITHTPTNLTSTEVSIQINIADAFTGIKKLTNPDGTTTNKVNSIYRVSENGEYEFIVEDNAGNENKQQVIIENIDTISPQISGLILHQKANNKYQVSVKSNDISGIQKVVLNDGQALVKDLENEDFYKLDEINTLPTYIQVTDRAGNTTGNIDFLALPTISLKDYSLSETKRTDVNGTINGSHQLDYQIGYKKYTCSEKPCAIQINKNTEVKATNFTSNKASTKTLDISNINKEIVNLILTGERSPSNPNEIKFSWNKNISNPQVMCSIKSGNIEFTPDSNPYLFNGKNQLYECKIKGDFEGSEIESNFYTIYPDYSEEIIQPISSDSYTKILMSINVYSEKNIAGKTFFINFKKNNNTEQDVPIPSALLK